MPGTFTNLTVHIVFSTKERIPLMTGDLRAMLFPYIGGIVKGLGDTVIAIGGMSDHVHVVARVPPSAPISDVVRAVKSNSSRWINERLTTTKFAWQRGYGAFSVSESMVNTVAEYVRNQERHHRDRTFKEELELLLRRHGVEFDPRYVC